MLSIFVRLITTRSAQDETKLVTFITYFPFCHMVGLICISCLWVSVGCLFRPRFYVIFFPD